MKNIIMNDISGLMAILMVWISVETRRLNFNRRKNFRNEKNTAIAVVADTHSSMNATYWKLTKDPGVSCMLLMVYLVMARRAKYSPTADKEKPRTNSSG